MKWCGDKLLATMGIDPLGKSTEAVGIEAKVHDDDGLVVADGVAIQRR